MEGNRTVLIKYLSPCLRQTDTGKYEEWQRVVVRYQPIGVRRRFNPDDFAWVDMTEEMQSFLINEKKNREKDDDSTNQEAGRLTR